MGVDDEALGCISVAEAIVLLLDLERGIDRLWVDMVRMDCGRIWSAWVASLNPSYVGVCRVDRLYSNGFRSGFKEAIAYLLLIGFAPRAISN